MEYIFVEGGEAEGVFFLTEGQGLEQTLQASSSRITPGVSLYRVSVTSDVKGPPGTNVSVYTNPDWGSGCSCGSETCQCFIYFGTSESVHSCTICELDTGAPQDGVIMTSPAATAHSALHDPSPVTPEASGPQLGR